MPKRERDVLKILWNSFISSFKPRYHQRKLVGKDMHGTQYYEQTLTSHSSRTRPRRYFVPENDDFQQELPAEWEAWLRYRRKEPPTTDEVEDGYRLSVLKKVNALKLEQLYSQDKDENKPAQIPTPTKKKEFPVYEEYLEEGRGYKVKK